LPSAAATANPADVIRYPFQARHSEGQGRTALIVIADDNFSTTQTGQFLLFEVGPPAEAETRA